jgi:hypothetical protein
MVYQHNHHQIVHQPFYFSMPFSYENTRTDLSAQAGGQPLSVAILADKAVRRYISPLIRHSAVRFFFSTRRPKLKVRQG